MPAKIGEIYDFDEYRLDVSEHLLLRRNEPVPLPEKAFEMLRLLVRNAGSLIEKEEILNEVWAEAFVEENNLDKNISILRRTLGERKGGKKFIQTVRGHGYRFIAEVRKTQGSTPVQGEENSSELQNTNPKIQGSPSGRLEIQRTGNVFALAEWRRENDESDKNNDVQTGETGKLNPCENKKSNGFGLKNIAGNLPRIAFAVLAIIAAVFLIKYFFRTYNLKTSSDAPFASYKIKRFFDNGSFNPAVVSPDGKFIAFTDKNFAVWLKNTATDKNVKIVSESGDAERSLIGISPDDGYIFFRQIPKEKPSQILKMPVFGGSNAQIIAEDSWSQPSLSPDGTKISFTRFDPESGKFYLIAADAGGAGARAIAESRENERFDSWNQNTGWSPDGNQIACLGRNESVENANRFIQIFRVADGAEISRIKIEPKLRALQSVFWQPDGDNLLVIAGDEASLGQIYRYQISNGQWRRVTNDLNDYRSLSITSDGKTILTTSFQNQSNLWVLPVTDEKSAKQITFGFNTIEDATGLSWTADGRIVYATNAGGRWEIWMISADGTDQKQLTQNCAGNDECVMPFVSPDNRFIVFQAARNGENNIWRMEIDGANPTQLTFDGGILPFVSADSRSVVYVQKKISSSTLRQISIDGGEARLVTKIAPVFLGNLSPDGKRIAYIYHDKNLPKTFPTCVSDIEVAKPEKCFEKSRAFPVWAKDGNSFYTLAHDYSAIWKQFLSGERELFLKFDGERINNFAFSPDGKQMVVARSKPTQDIVALIDER